MECPQHPVSAAQLAKRMAARQTVFRAAAEWTCAHAPKIREEILQKADLALQGKIRIGGSGQEYCDIGTPPAWKEIRTPDSHYGSDLNRMLHWDTLVKAFFLTGEGRYAQRLVMEALDWVKSCPRPPLPREGESLTNAFYGVDGEVVPWHCLNSGIRLFEFWRQLLEALAGTPFLSDEALTTLAYSMREQAEAIRSVSPRLFPDAHHNHYLMEMLGVLSFARLFPDLPDARDWGKAAAAELERCALAQLSEDGAQIEGCPSYHNGCQYWFCLARQYAADCGTPLSAEADARIRNGFRHAIYATRACGTEMPWGDSHPGFGHIGSALWGLYAFNDSTALAQAARFTPSEAFAERVAATLWQAPDLARFHSAAEAVVPSAIATTPAPSVDSGEDWPRIHWERNVKQVSLRTDWTQQALGLYFAAFSPGHYGFHGHSDPCGFDFCAYGAPLIIDSGCGAYYDSEQRRRSKSAAGHNMLTVSYREPFEYCSSFAYGPQKEGGIDWVREEPRFLAVQGFHRNYDPALHRRALLILDDRLLVVLDSVSELFWLSSVQLYFQLPFETVDALPEGGVRSCGDGVNVAVVTDSELRLAVPPYRLHPESDAPRITTARFDDLNPEHRTALCHATVIAPARAGKELPAIKVEPCRGTPECWECVFTVDSTTYALEWRPDGIVLR